MKALLIAGILLLFAIRLLGAPISVSDAVMTLVNRTSVLTDAEKQQQVDEYNERRISGKMNATELASVNKLIWTDDIKVNISCEKEKEYSGMMKQAFKLAIQNSKQRSESEKPRTDLLGFPILSFPPVVAPIANRQKRFVNLKDLKEKMKQLLAEAGLSESMDNGFLSFLVQESSCSLPSATRISCARNNCFKESYIKCICDDVPVTPEPVEAPRVVEPPKCNGEMKDGVCVDGSSNLSAFGVVFSVVLYYLIV